MKSDEPTQHPELSRAQFWHYYQRYPYLLAKVALWAGAVAVLYWLTRNVEAVLFPVAVSFLVAYLLDPAVDWLEGLCDRIPALKRAQASRTMAIIVFMGLILTAVVGFILVLYPALAKQISTLVKRAPELANLAQNNLLPWLERTTGYAVPATVSEAIAEYGGAIREQVPAAAKRLSSMTGEVLSKTGSVVASLLNLVMIPIFSFYFLRDFDLYKTRLRELVPLNRREFYLTRISLMDEVVGAWFRGQVTVALILAVLYAVGLAIVFAFAGAGIGSGIAIGLLAGILNIVPYFGFLIGFVLSVLMVVLNWSGFGPLIGVCVVFAIVQGLEGWVITPKIVGDKVGLSPVTVIIVLLLGGELFGLLGVLLALPVAGIVRALLPDIIESYRGTPFYSGDYGAETAVADAAQRSYQVIPFGLSEQTDGSIDEDDEEVDEEPKPPVDTSALKRPITQEHASVGERPKSAAAPLDAGTDGDAADQEAPADAVDDSPAADPDETGD